MFVGVRVCFSCDYHQKEHRPSKDAPVLFVLSMVRNSSAGRPCDLQCKFLYGKTEENMLLNDFSIASCVTAPFVSSAGAGPP